MSKSVTAFEWFMDRIYGHNIWDGFEPLPRTAVTGWNGDHPALAAHARNCVGPFVIIDVGVWKGMSTISMAKAIKEAGLDGVVISVDTFLGSPEHFFMRDDFQRKNSIPNLSHIFMSNVYHEGVSDYVIPLPQTSVTAVNVLQRVNCEAALIHVDAAHEYEEVIRDLREYWKVLRPTGVMIGDDYMYGWPGVIKAAGEFSAELCLPMEVEFPKFIIKKPPA
ncbi:class I SAM-dependent methyltransferase [Methylobacterium sp. DB1607]|jgi:SAM-dependent methyltransferase|nr:class I SAM-dependent methyltransferase [Methylobacterium sp. DB1607]